MSFAGILETIQSPRLRRIALHWDEARNGGRMPGWTDISPNAIRGDVSIVWSWKYDRKFFVGSLVNGRPKQTAVPNKSRWLRGTAAIFACGPSPILSSKLGWLRG